MSVLPANFPVHHLSPVSKSKLEWYYRNYVEAYYAEYKFGHFLLAAYASVPALLTPDLLYKIWQNFNAYKWQGVPSSIHPIAVSDILLSPLCIEVGFELYEMEQEIKLALLEWLKIIEEDKKSLWGKRGIESIIPVANFIHEYHSLPNSGQVRWGRPYTDWQEVDALAYTNPQEAASRLLHSITELSAGNNEMDLLRTLEQFIKTQKKLNRIHSGEGEQTLPFNQNINQLEAVKNLLENNSSAFLEQVLNDTTLPNFSAGAMATGITIKMPVPVQEKLTETLRNKQRRRKIFASVIGIDEFPGFTNQSFSFCRNNANRFATALPQFAAALNREIEIFQAGDLGFAQENLHRLYNFYQQAEDGDSCVFFYSGMGLMDNQYRIRDVIVAGDTPENLQVEDTRPNLTVHLNELVARKNIHVLIITDFHGVFQVKRTFPVFNPPAYHGSIIFLKNFDNDDDWLSNVETGLHPPEINNFCHALFEILSQGGYRYSYHEIFSQLKLRMSSLGPSRPAKYSFPQGASERKVLTGEEKKINSFVLSFDAQRGWCINAGLQQGIRPSLPFMETFFRDQSNNRYAVEMVDYNYSTIKNFEENIDKTFTLTLAQNALPKVRVAFAENISPEMRSSLLSNIGKYDIYYIDLVEDRNSAYYLIGNREDEFILTRREHIHGQNQQQAPVFDYQRSPFEFIKAMEYIAQWQGVLEFDNRETALDREQVWFAFDKIEGRAININSAEPGDGERIPDYEPVVLHYRKVGDNWIAPSLRCKISRAQRPLHIHVLYLDAMYGISKVGQAQAEPGNEFYLTGEGDLNSVSTFELRIPDYFLEKEITEATEYMKFFISEAPMDLDVLIQEGLQVGSRPLTRTVEKLREQNRELLDTTRSEWVSVTIPITIVKKEISKASLENPFPGLHAFKEADSGIFFGRKTAMDQLLQAAIQYRIVIVSGFAGSGKSSLVNAGLLPKLEGEIIKIPFEALNSAESFRLEIDKIPGNIDKAYTTVRNITSANLRPQKPGRDKQVRKRYIVIDNYQHLLKTSGPELVEIEKMINELALENYLIIIVKTDAELLFRRSPVIGLLREKGSGKIIRPIRQDAWRMEIPELNSKELREIITGLAAAAKIEFDDDLINRLVKDSLQANHPLPLLSSTLYQLAQAALGGNRKSTMQDYGTAGGIGRAESAGQQQSFQEKVLQNYRGREVYYADDPQKGRWGGEAHQNDKVLSAVLIPSEIKNLYRLRVLLDCDSKKDIASGQVAFFVSDNYNNEIEFTDFVGGKARLEKTIYEPFTIGALTEDGTMLELDLATIAPFQPEFHLQDIPDNFEQQVRTIYKSTPRGPLNDPQKGRWGRLATNGVIELSAKVEWLESSHFFRVHLTIKSHQSSDPLRGTTAFFLHESYEEPILFRKAVNGEFTLTITAFEAFTVGACTSDNNFLELDLNNIPGFPAEFYSQSNPA